MRTKAEIIQGLTEEQRAGVIDYVGLRVLNAAPGSGKTSCVVSRTEYMIADGIDPTAILLFTFTRKAAEEMRTRLKANIGDVAKRMTICTYHSFCSRLLRKYADLLGWTKDFTIYDETDKHNVMAKIVKNERDLKIDTILNYISTWKSNYINPDQAAAGAQNSFEAKSAIYYKAYRTMMQQQNAFDFDDLLYYGYQLIKEHPSVLNALNQHYRYVICDESHDSSVQDMKFIMLLGNANNNITLVADTDQSIYGFRGADVNNFTSVIKQSGFKVYNLSRNFRSTKTIVNAAQTVIENNQDPIKKTVFSMNEQGQTITYYDCKDIYEESLMVARIAKFLHTKMQYDYKDIAVLCRLTHQTRAIEEKFITNNIPYHIVSGTSFYARQEIKDLVSYLRISSNPYDVEAFERSVAIPKRGIGIKTLLELEKVLFHSTTECDTIRTDDLLSICENHRFQFNKKIQENLLSYVQIVRNLRGMMEEGIRPRDILQNLINEIQYEQWLDETEKDREMLQQRYENIQELLNVATQYTSFDEFMENVMMNSSSAEDDENADKVNIMTMHASKGLEFRAVVMIGLNEGTIPHRRSLDSIDNIKEERRLFYVAMTRAKELLFMTRPFMTFCGTLVQNKQSRFVDEISEEYITKTSIN
jgi:DNA helicase-2/ATP-dependent DNA helicase PcrA